MLARALTIATALLVLTAGCGPDDKPRDSCRQKPTFLVTIEPEEGTFPADTRVSFEYGGGIESFELRTEPEPQVVFCEAHAAAAAEGAAGAGGASGTAETLVTEIVCELWTGGSTDVAVTASGFEPLTGFKLRTDRELCTVAETITLEPDVE